MSITITKPTQKAEIVTDYAALQQSIELANEINTAKASGKSIRSLQAKKGELRKLVTTADDSTLVLTLHGLNSSAWNAIVIEHTHNANDRIVKDWPAMIKDSIPLMLDKMTWKTKPAPVELDGDALAALLESLTDSQTQELMVTVQALNTPVTAVPKEVRDLL